MTKLIMLVGIPASGKSTFATQIAEQEDAHIHASDELRKELFGDANVKDKNNEVFSELHRRIKEDLSQGKSVVYDATNISHKRRKAFLDELRTFDVEKVCYFIATPYEKCLAENSQRERKVPEHVIKKMYMNIYVPQYYEGWDDIKIIWNTEDYSFDIYKLFNGENGLNKINQDNPHHLLTIGGHCAKCCEICANMSNDIDLLWAALLHDIGKRFTKTFRNSKREITEIAHYFQHHLVSAYDALFYLNELGFDDESILNIVNYIQWHMYPFFIKQDSTRNKFINLVGQEFYDNLMILHEADEKASGTGGEE